MSYSPISVGGAGPYFELRLYEMVQTRLAGLTISMGQDVPALFQRHGMPRPLCLWEGFAGPFSPLYGYLLRWEDLDHRMTSWGSFYSDPDFIAALARNYGGEQRVERANISFMCRSPVWDAFQSEFTGLLPAPYEIRLYDARALPLDESRQRVNDELSQDRSAGSIIMGVFETIIGAWMPRIVAFLSHRGGRSSGLELYLSRSGQSDPIPGLQHDSFLVQPTDYGTARSDLSSHPEI
jgi:hypothetical protein